LAEANDVIQAKNKALSDANDAIAAEAAEKERQRLLAVANEKTAVEKHHLAERRLDQSVATLKLFANDARTYCEDALVPGASKQKLFGVLADQLDALAASGDEKEFDEDKFRAHIFLHETVALTEIELGRNVKAEESLKKALK